MIHTLIPSHPLETTLSEDNLSHQEHIGSKKATNPMSCEVGTVGLRNSCAIRVVIFTYAAGLERHLNNRQRWIWRITSIRIKEDTQDERFEDEEDDHRASCNVLWRTKVQQASNDQHRAERAGGCQS
jgi:hypothetical protein